MTTTLLDAIARLETALENLARALATGEAEPVLSAEEPLASAAATLGVLARSSRPDTNGLAEAVTRARAAVGRCQTLGGSAEAFARAVFPQTAYTRAGLRIVSAAAPRRVTSIS